MHMNMDRRPCNEQFANVGLVAVCKLKCWCRSLQCPLPPVSLAIIVAIIVAILVCFNLQPLYFPESTAISHRTNVCHFLSYLYVKNIHKSITVFIMHHEQIDVNYRFGGYRKILGLCFIGGY